MHALNQSTAATTSRRRGGRRRGRGRQSEDKHDVSRQRHSERQRHAQRGPGRSVACEPHAGEAGGQDPGQPDGRHPDRQPVPGADGPDQLPHRGDDQQDRHDHVQGEYRAGEQPDGLLRRGRRPVQVVDDAEDELDQKHDHGAEAGQPNPGEPARLSLPGGRRGRMSMRHPHLRERNPSRAAKVGEVRSVLTRTKAPSGEQQKPGNWLLLVGLGAFAVALGLYVIYMVIHPKDYTMDPVDLAVYRSGGLIVRHVRPLYNPRLAAPLYDWIGYGKLHLPFTYTPFAAISFALISFVPWSLSQHLS